MKDESCPQMEQRGAIDQRGCFCFSESILGSLILVVVTVLTSCSRSPDESREPTAAAEATRAADRSTNSSIVITNVIVSALASNTLVVSNKLRFVELLGDTDSDRSMAKDLLLRSPEAREALLQAKQLLGKQSSRINRLLVTNVISETDVAAIEAELTHLKHFKPSSDPGIVINYGQVQIVIIGGDFEDEYRNAYLIRIPGQGWRLLETQSVPRPMRTSASW